MQRSIKGIRNLFATLTICMLLAPGISYAQILERSTEESDLQVRAGFSFDKKILKGFHLTWSEEVRLKNGVSELDRIYSVITASYEILPWLEAGADYTFIAVKQAKGWEFRNRSNLDITGSYRLGGRWKFSLRERFRITSANRHTDPLTEVNPSWIMRSRLTAEYSVPRLPLKPYLFFELSNTLNTPVIDNYIDKIRVSAGVKYAVSPRSEFDFFYRYDHNRSKELTWPSNGAPWIVTTEKQNNHIIGLFYEYSF